MSELSTFHRRTWLKTAGLAVGSLVGAAPRPRRATAGDLTSKPVGAIIGCGVIARYLLDCYIKSGRCQIAATCDVDEKRREDFADRVVKGFPTSYAIHLIRTSHFVNRLQLD